MPEARDFLGESLFSPGVLRDLDKENIDSTATGLPARTPDGGTRRKLSAIKLYHDDNTNGGLAVNLAAKGKVPIKTPLSQNSATGSTALSCAKAEVDMERRQAIAALKQRNERVQDLKAATAPTNERYTALLKSHEEATKELAVLRTQLTSGGSGMAANMERLKAEAQSLETSNELLREERSSLAARLAKREAACAGMKDELAAASQREGILRGELERVRQELEEASREASEKAEALAAAEKGKDDRIDNAELALHKAAMEAQVKDLEEQLAAAVRRCGSVVAERAVMAEESMRQNREHDMIVAGLQEELHVMHRRTSADLGDWQRRHYEAVTARKAVEGQLERLASAGKSIALVGERQSALEASLQEACELLSVTLNAQLSGERVGVMQQREGEVGGPIGVLAPERVVEGVIEHVLGRVFEASSRSESDGVGEEEQREREAEHELRREALAALGDTLETLTAEMETLRESSVAEATIYLEQTQQLGAELDEARKQHQAAISKLDAERAASQKEVERLAQRVKEGDGERERLELQLETTVQLSEMALAASVKAGEEDQQQEASQRTTEEAGDAEAMEKQKNLRWEELEAERRGYAEKVEALEGENRLLHGKLEDLAAQASSLKAKVAARDVDSPTKRLSSEEARAREAALESMEARLKAILAENEKLERAMVSVTGEAEQASFARDERQAQIAVLEDEVKMLQGSVEDERARVARAKAADAAMRKYLLHYHTRNEQKMKEMQRRLANATARSAEQSL